MAFLVGSTAPGIQRLAVPFASLLIAALGYGSQWLFLTSPDLKPGPLTTNETRLFNTLLVCLWWTYWRACTVDPGRYEFPRPSSKKGDGKLNTGKSGGEESVATHSSEDEDEDEDEAEDQDNTGARIAPRRRWCRKCAAPKPPRAHHCKGCGRCIPRMDHHCPWTGNCVSLQTFPHFVRFILYTNASLWTLGYFLWARFTDLWSSRDLPAYLGPSLAQLGAFTALCLTTFLTALALGILLLTTVRGWVLNTTMIEGWEIERHEAVVQRGGGGSYGDNDVEEDWWRTGDGDGAASPRTMIDPVEFPYDIGVYSNMAQAMGTSNPLYWPLPFVDGPRIARLSSNINPEDLAATLDGAKTGGAALGAGWHYDENGLNDREGMWPPLDPEKVRNARLWRQRRREEARYRREMMRGLRNPVLPELGLTPEEEKAAFQRRQARDFQFKRWRRGDDDARREILHELEEMPSAYDHALNATPTPNPSKGKNKYEERNSNKNRDSNAARNKPRWVNADGEHLGDYGVDEDAEYDYGYDDVPILDNNGYLYDEGREREQGVQHTSLDPDDEEVPLAELIRRRKVRKRDGEDV
ncbi:DHHC palmitoyltransferase-domain-containing protein [Xylaria arbuscula]|nr:DHHC palmitoyltransferase-domain-containing protein [Xylaria arbuscula]